MTKKLIKFMIIGTGLLVLLFVVLWLISLFRGGKLSYDKIEDKMISAAESYYKNNANLLPKDDYSKVELDASTLVADGYMKSFDKYTDENVSCNGKIIVIKNGENHTYIPKLNCGNDYSTTTLSQKILENESIITEGDGLYEYNEEYVYRGEKLNNYVSFAGKTWRVLRITKDRELRLIQNDSFEKVVWDNRYNASKKSSTGINDYEINGIDSRIKESLKEIYDSEILKSKDKAKLVPKQLCIGKRAYGDTTFDGSKECELLTEEYYSVGMLQANEYLIPSLDTGCTALNKIQCMNYNFLSTFEDSFWTITANAENTHEVYYVDYLPSTAYANRKFGIKLVININNEVNYTTGDGTLENPYVID